ncbi:MAG: hypothetical protein FWG73_06080 [Planctomycetaceae bacterium]|nr:hypothetical protein [Planctomycetaceae bacterium]
MKNQHSKSVGVSAYRNARGSGIASVIPAQAGIQQDRSRVARLDSGVRRNDGFFVRSNLKYALTPVFLLLVLLTGCASTIKMPQVDLASLKPPGPVTSVIATWEPAISNGENAQRGFGGRVYFHDQDWRPAKIKGTVIVYVFEEDGRTPGDAKPNEGIVFDEKTLNSKGVYSKSSLGHSYNLWVPVDVANPESPMKKVSLIVRYVPDKGTPVMSSQTTSHLPGRREQFAPNWVINTETQQLQHSVVQHSTGEHVQSLQAVTIR